MDNPMPHASKHLKQIANASAAVRQEIDAAIKKVFDESGQTATGQNTADNESR